VPYFVYILKSLKDSRFYIGQTNNIEKRLERHLAGQVKSTKNRRPLILIHKEIYKTRPESMRRENYLKSLKSSKYIEKEIIKSQLENL
jgi:putative endonuclease